jgi:hypothetical protein
MGHLSNESLRQVFRLSSNNLSGSYDAMFAVVRYSATGLDDGTDCIQDSHLMVSEKIRWPPPSFAEPCNLPVLRSYTEPKLTTAVYSTLIKKS